MSILDRYGIKEVADVTFYDLDSIGRPTNPVLYLDTLKVSTIEQSAENTSARGGKGNPEIIMWDYGKEITVTLEDALFSPKSLAIMFGNGTVTKYESDANTTAFLMKTEKFVATAAASVASATSAGWVSKYVGPNGSTYTKYDAKFYDENGSSVTSFTSGVTYFCTFDLKVTGSVIEVSGNTFPGTYYVTGDTYARSEASGNDDFFQFIIPKAKIEASNTITLQADGDPSVFSMNLRVLRPADGIMMKLVQYNIDNPGAGDAAAFNLYHNHTLTGTGIDPVYPTAG